MRWAIVIVSLVLFGLGLALVCVPVFGGWPEPENPPRQGEALDPVAYESGRFAHSQTALARLIREPQNTWSNLAFVLTGAWLMSAGTSRSARLVGAMLIGVGIGSFLYHASASRTLRHLDVGAMYGLFFATTVLSIGSLSASASRRFETYPAIFWTCTLAFAVAATVSRNAVVLGVKPFALTPVTALASAILMVTLVALAWRQRNARITAATGVALGLFATAVACQIGDRPSGWLCHPGALVQAHTLWHLFSAAALLMTVIIVDRETLGRGSAQPIASRTVSGAVQLRSDMPGARPQ